MKHKRYALETLNSNGGKFIKEARVCYSHYDHTTSQLCYDLQYMLLMPCFSVCLYMCVLGPAFIYIDILVLALIPLPCPSLFNLSSSPLKCILFCLGYVLYIYMYIYTSSLCMYGVVFILQTHSIIYCVHL